MARSTGRLWALVAAMLLIAALGCDNPPSGPPSSGSLSPSRSEGTQGESSGAPGSSADGDTQDAAQAEDSRVASVGDAPVTEGGSYDDLRPPNIYDYFDPAFSPEEAYAEQRYVVDFAEHMSDCMRAQGFADFLMPPDEWTMLYTQGVIEGVASSDRRERGYGFGANLTIMAGIGDGDSTSFTNTSPQSLAIIELVESLDAAELAAFNDGLVGCTEFANENSQHLYEWISAEMHQLIVDLESRIQADPELRRVWDEWSVCMAKEGHGHASRDSLIDDLAAEADAMMREVEIETRGQPLGAGELPGPVEDEKLLQAIRTFSAKESLIRTHDDVCAETVNVAGVYETVSAHYMEEFLEEHGVRLELMSAEAEAFFAEDD